MTSMPPLRGRASALAALALCLSPVLAQSQKRPITHDDYKDWPSISGSAISNDGKWLAYEVRPARGDGELVVRAVDGKKRHVIARGGGARFSHNGRYLIFTERKSQEKERQKRIAELHKSGKTSSASSSSGSSARQRSRGRGRGRGGSSSSGRGTLIVLDLKTGKQERIENTRSSRLLQDGKFLALHFDKPKPKPSKKKPSQKKPQQKPAGKTPAKPETPTKPTPAKPAAVKKEAAKKAPTQKAQSKKPAKPSSAGTDLVLRDLATGKEIKIAGVKSYSSVAKDAWLMLIQEGDEALRKKHNFVDGLAAYQIQGGRRVQLLEGKASYSSFTTDTAYEKLAFVSNLVELKAAEARKKAAKDKKNKPEQDKKSPRYDIYTWDFSPVGAQRLVACDNPQIPPRHEIQAGRLSFSRDGSVLGFGIRQPAAPELPKILPEEKVTVDIWHWNDGLIQPMQARQRRSTRLTLSAVWHLQDDRLVVVGNEDMPSVTPLTDDGSRAMASDGKPYEKMISYDGRYADYYVVNTLDGTRQRILRMQRSRPSPSPSGRHLLYLGADAQWHCMNLETRKSRCLTKTIPVSFVNELEDRPQPARAYGIVGWLPGEQEVVLQARYDLWRINVETGAFTCLSDGYGRANEIELRYSRFDWEADDDELSPERRRYLPETLVLSAKNDRTKARGYFLETTAGLRKPQKLVMMDATIGGLRRAKDAERLFFTKSRVDTFPDIWTADMAFEGRKQLSDACPIQREVRWGSAELVEWRSNDGAPLQGYLVKPDGFDPKKKYPMMVYFYERNSDNLHRYRRPGPGTSPNQSYYVSQGYLWFVPDIIYEIGYPGESSEKCVITGVQHLIAQGFVDEKAIGIAGHSWGGYQTAHLVTRSNLFAAAESGAPVSNMFSAYGGIRYSSGMSRQFQYERTQSRIGGSPWQYPQRYWQNSPVFYADRVQTPVLILHNDEDGAVPWTNGIEFFMALRRMDKEAYLFNYNGEAHGLRKRANQMDWTRRMAEFFDHHLRGAPAPKWMREGVPYAEREREKIPHVESLNEAKAKKAAAGVSEASSSGSR